MYRRLHRPMLYAGLCRIRSKIIIAFPISGRTDGALRKATATVWANVLEHAVDTVRAERAFITADTGVQGVRRQSLIAVFTGGSDVEHFNFLPSVIKRSADRLT
jgi:hypothetical protein